MSLILPPAYMQNLSTHTAETDRSVPNVLTLGPLTSGSLKSFGGVNLSLGGGLKVTQSGSPAMSVDVASGTCLVPGSEGAKQGQYTAVNDASITVTVTASHPTLPRIDLVTISVRDAQYSGANNDLSGNPVVTAGTPASSPAVPTAPANSLVLAQILVGAAVVSIVNANITDRRLPITASGGVYVCTTTTFPTNGLYEGMFAYTTNTDQLWYYSGSAWTVVPTPPTGAWTDYSASVGWTSAGTAPVIGNGTMAAAYQVIGKQCTYNGRMTMGSTSSFGSANAWTINLPVAAANSNYTGATFYFDASVTANKTGGAIIPGGSTVSLASVSGPANSTIPIPWTTSDYFAWSITYQTV